MSFASALLSSLPAFDNAPMILGAIIVGVIALATVIVHHSN